MDQEVSWNFPYNNDKPKGRTLLQRAERAIEIEDGIIASDPSAKDRRAMWRAYEWTQREPTWETPGHL